MKQSFPPLPATHGSECVFQPNRSLAIHNSECVSEPRVSKGFRTTPPIGAQWKT
jgi:hypothetical protein